MTSEPNRWWPAADARSLLAVPPFPGSRVPPTSLPDPGAEWEADELRQCAEAIRRHRVGGTFWGAQPAVAAGALVLRPRDLSQYHAMRAAADGRNVVAWFPDRAAHRAAGGPDAALIGACDPWHLFAHAAEIWSDADDVVAVLAPVAGVVHRAFDPSGRDLAQSDPVERLGEAIRGIRFLDPFSGASVSPSAFAATLGFWRRLIDANRPIGPVYGVARWKRPSLAALLWNGTAPVEFRHRARLSARDARAAAMWVARTPAATLRTLEAAAVPPYQIEDGFIRSVGLGAECVPPLSIVVDPYGAHYDPAQPSGLERLLADQPVSDAMLERAARLRAVIVERGVSKYGSAAETFAPRPADGPRRVLVTGQVEDDQSVVKGGGGLCSNLALLRRVRALEPDARILYRPHPDVERGHRKGHIDDATALAVADEIAREGSIGALIDSVDHVHVLTSLAGFEALLRGRPVTTHGVPFYAGWGLTTDLGAVPERRARVLTLDHLVAATLLLYPRYLDPVTGLPCPPETLVERIVQGHQAPAGALIQLRRRLGDVVRLSRRLSPGLAR